MKRFKLGKVEWVIVIVIELGVAIVAALSFLARNVSWGWTVIGLGLVLAGLAVTAGTTPESEKKKIPYVLAGVITLLGVVVTGLSAASSNA